MVRDGFLIRLCIVIIVCLFISPLVNAAAKDGSSVTVDPLSTLSTGTGQPPINSDTFHICLGDTVFDTLAYFVSDPTSPLVSLELIVGLGTLTSGVNVTQDSLLGFYQFMPDTAGIYEIAIRKIDNDGFERIHHSQYVIYFDGDPPVIDDQSFVDVACNLTSMRSLPIVAIGSDLLFTLLSGPGSIDPVTGLLTYTPDTSGTFLFTVEVQNSCGADTATITDMLTLNTPPQVFCRDSLIFLCEPQEICIDVTAYDPDGDPVEIFKLEGLGEYTQLTDTSGVNCFMPADVDSAVYMFIFRAADSCVLGNKSIDFNECCRDTSLITVVMNRPPEVVCPEPQSFFDCEGGEFCFPFTATDYENEPLTFNILTENALYAKGQICLTTDNTLETIVSVEVVDACGEADTCHVLVNIDINDAPTVTLADDYAITLCDPETICVDAFVSDPNANIETIYNSFGDYNQQTGKICFTPDTSGIYVIDFSVTDSCGLTDSASIAVTVDLNQTPQFSLGDDFEVTLCAFEEICILPTITDDNYTRMLTNVGFYDPQTGKLCFTPDTSGLYTIIGEVIDDCDVSVFDTVMVDVTVKDKPTLSLGDDFSVALCDTEEICVDLISNTPLDLLTISYGTLNDSSQICFTPDTAGVYTIIAEITDDCQLTAVDTLFIEVTKKSAPVISNFADTSVYICNPTSICLPVTITDLDDDIISITVNRGTYENGQVCFVPYDSGSYEIILTATDACGNMVSDTAVATVTTDQGVDIIVPNDTSFFTCELDTFCFPVSGIPAGAVVSVTGINTWFDAENSQICYYAECASANKITLTAATECSTFEETFTVTVNCNTAPLAILPQDTTIFACEPAEICLPVGVTDVDNNLADISTTGASYDPIMNQLCFMPDTAGVYTLTLTATDSCGLTDYDEIRVTVTFNSAPTCNLPEYQLFTLCDPGQIVVPFSVFDVDGNLSNCILLNEFGSLNDTAWVFNAVADDSFTVSIQCVDECGQICESDMTVVIDINEAPACVVPNDTLIELCDLSPVSLPVYGVDMDDELVTCTVVNGPGMIVDDFWTYTPNGTEMVEVTVRCEDECGHFCETSFTVDFKINQTPQVFGFDTTVTLCDPELVCFDVFGNDPDGTTNFLFSIEQFDGSAQIEQFTNDTSAQICFTPNDVDSALYQFVIGATDDCRAMGIDTVNVLVLINRAPIIACPKDQLFFGCGTNEFCFDITAFDPDNDQISYTVLSNNAVINGNTICLTTDTSLYVDIVVEAMDACGHADTCTIPVSVTMNQPPIISSLSTFDYDLCQPGEVCFDISVSDPEQGEVIVTVNNGTYQPDLGTICFNADTTGMYTIITTAEDTCGLSVYDTTMVTVNLNTPPTVEIGDDFAVSLCQPGEVCFDALISDINLHSYSLSNGVYTDELRQICFMADTSGMYPIEVSVIDSCGATTFDTVTVTVMLAEGPFISLGENNTALECEDAEICIPVNTIDNYVSFETSQNALFNEQNKELCFTSEGPGDYTLWMTVTDTCGLTATDSIVVTVEFNQPPVIACPKDQVFFGCGTTDFCFDISAFDPENDTVTFDIISGNAILDGNTICLTTDTSMVIDLVITATDPCGAADTCSVPVTVTMNEAPVITSSTTYDFELCQSGEVCFDISVVDPDNDDFTVIVDNGQYDPNLGTICFGADTSGSYQLIAIAADTCGLSVYDTITVNVTVNSPPVVNVNTEDLFFSLCQPDSVCFPVEITDGNLDYINVPNGVYHELTSEVCFLADTSGTYQVELTVVDSCEVSLTDTIFVTVTLSEGPVVDLGDDHSLLLCEEEEVCLDVTTIENYTDVSVSSGATYNPQTHQLCFLPEGPGVYELWMTVTDTCGLTASDTVNIEIDLNNQPHVIPLPDTTVYLCYPTEICLPAVISDPENNVTTVVPNIGTFERGYVCFTPYDSGTFELILTITDACGASIQDTSYITVKTDQTVDIGFPGDTSFFTCELDTVCFPLDNVPANATVSVTGINTWYNEQSGMICFYPECATANKITVTVSTPCNDFTGEFTATVNCNTKPLIILPQDTMLMVCEPSEVCLPVGVSDIDGNLTSVTATNATYDPIMSNVCFTADTAGIYIVTVSAIDSCGAVDNDQITVQVVFNSAPEITYTEPDQTLMSCDGEEVCVDVNITDINDNLLSISTSLGSFNAETSQLCFIPDTTGYYCIEITATDECGVQTQYTACVNVEVGGYVTFSCPEPILADSLCVAGEVCVALDISGEVLSVNSSLGSFNNGQLCFQADTAGTYMIEVTATADCNSITCTVEVMVGFYEAVAVSCPASVDTLLCGPDTLCFDFTSSASVSELSITPPAYINGTQVCVPVLQDSDLSLTLVGSGDCGVDSCMFSVKAVINSAPVLTIKDSTYTVCELDTICIPFTATDINENIMEITATGGVINGSSICILPAEFGANTATITVTDSCGEQSQQTVTVTPILGPSAEIICPGNQFATLCGADSVHALVPVSPLDADLTVLMNDVAVDFNYNTTTGVLSLFMDTEGTHAITVIAESICGADTCEFDYSVSIAVKPQVTCPDQIDTLLCLAEPTQLCFPVEAVGTGVEVTVNPFGSFSAGVACIPIDTAGTYTVELIASSDCGADTCVTTVNVTADELPVLVLPADASFEWCPGDTNLICLDGIFGYDTEDMVSLTQVCGPGTFELATVDSGSVCFLPETSGLYAFCFEVSDGCHTVTDTFYVDIVEKEDCDVCVRVSIDGGQPIPVGTFKDVFLNIETNTAIGGFDILLSYDASVMAFSAATIEGSAIEGWEYFTFRLGSEDCGQACPSGLVRLVGIAEINNGPNHPPIESLNPNGLLVKMTFQVANDQNLGDQFLPITFSWYDCGDNTFANTTGTILYLDSRIYNSEGMLVWDEDDDAMFPDISRPFGMGADDSCLIGGKTTPVRCVEFINGGIRVIHPDSIDARGDLNLNNVSNEIGDAVLYSNYFIYGLSVFTINQAGQIAASDVNADGLTLSVADLVLLIRIIIGDANPIPKLIPYDEQLLVTTEQDGYLTTISTDAVADIGAAHLVFDLKDSDNITDIYLSADADNMDMIHHIENNQLRVLIYNIGRELIPAGTNELLVIETDAQLTLTKSEFTDYQGRPYATSAKTGSLPNGFALNQNYPNPFNPTTTISMAIPYSSDYTLSIFNINGSLVKQFVGSSEAGYLEIVWDGTNENGSSVASGMYFYRFEAANFTETKKMMLLK